MNLKAQIRDLSKRIPEPRRPRAPVPVESLAAFVRGFLSGAFTAEDIDRTNYAQMNSLAEFNATLITFSAEHQKWCDATPWARADQDRWVKANLGELTPEELDALKAFAKRCYPAQEQRAEA